LYSEVDFGAVSAQAGFALSIFLLVFSLVLLGMRRAASRLDDLANRYTASLDSSLSRSRVLDDMGVSGRVIGRLSLESRYRLTSLVVIVALLALVMVGVAIRDSRLAFLSFAVIVIFPFALARMIDVFNSRRIAQIESALPDAVAIMGSSLGAGLTFQTALGAVAANMRGPIGTETRIASNQIAAGSSPADALAAMAKRNQSDYLGLFVAATRVHLMHGGNLSIALQELGKALTKILLAEGEIRARTAGARRDTALATAVPFLVVPLGYLIEPEIFGRLFTTIGGQVLLVISGAIWLYSVWRLHKICNRRV
jgi:tight adherence protein B